MTTKCSIGELYGSKGSFKNVHELVKDRRGNFVITIPRGKQPKDYVIISFDVFKEENVFFEIQKYEELKLSGFCPLILCIFENDHSHEMTVTDFLNKYESDPIPSTLYIIMEKYNCSTDALQFFYEKEVFNSHRFFTELRDFLTRLVEFGYYSLDMKIENICYDRQKGFVIIDLDPKFFKLISHPEFDAYYVNYMLFQTYILLSHKINAHFDDLNITENEYRNMMRFILNQHNLHLRDKEYITELRMLFFYSKMSPSLGINQFDKYTPFIHKSVEVANVAVSTDEDVPPVEKLLQQINNLKKTCDKILGLYVLPQQDKIYLENNVRILNQHLEKIKSQLNSYAQIVRNSKSYMQNYRELWGKYLSEDEKRLPFEQVNDLVQKRLMDAYGLQIKCERAGKCALIVAAAAYTLKKVFSGGKTHKRKHKRIKIKN